MTPTSPPPPPDGTLRRALRDVRKKVISGLIAALPVVITFWIFYWLYLTLRSTLLNPTAALIQRLVGRTGLRDLPVWWEQYVAPLLAILLALAFLYVLGYFARSRIFRLIDWILQRVPVVTLVYKAVRNLFQSLESQRQGLGYQRVVLVPFPHPGSRALAFVTKTLRDTQAGQTIVAVCVLTGVFPPTGFTLFFPENEVFETDWTVNDALQTIVSGGISAPEHIAYHTPRPRDHPVHPLSP
jgi:uncharacterized membrane protein